MFVKLCLVYKKHQYLPQFIMYVFNHTCHLEHQSHGWICLLLILTKLLRLSSIEFVKANIVDPDDMPYSVEIHLGVLVC